MHKNLRVISLNAIYRGEVRSDKKVQITEEEAEELKRVCSNLRTMILEAWAVIMKERRREK